MAPLSRALIGCLLCAVTGVQAVTLFADNEARQELLNLRQRLATLERTLERNLQEESRSRRELADQLQSLSNAQTQEQARRKQIEQTLEALIKTTEEQARVGRGSLELLNQLEKLRQDLARLRGENEALRDFVAGFQRGLADLRQSQADLRNNIGGVQAGLNEVQRAVKDAGALEERLRKVEPVRVSLEGRDFEALPAELAAYDAAVKAFSSDDHKSAQALFEQFLLRYPGSAYRPWVHYWLGSSQQATEEFKAAQASLRTLLKDFPGHPRSADAMLALAGVQFDLKEPRPVVRKTLEDLIKAYPGTKAAAVARDRLAKLK
ncbi:MAG: outer membrane protein assembly factor BamD [Betaproteobacteria bacterium]|nr:outer membrane protein assembly factor BamD [Betaproteobacteria bacterium]